MQTPHTQLIAAIVLLAAPMVSAQPAAQPTRTFSGHLGAVTMAEFTPDGKTIGTSSADHLLKLWNAATGEELKTLTGNTAPVSSMAISPNGLVLASGARDNTIKLWDIPQTKPVRVFAGHEAATTAFAFNAEATVFLTVSRDKTVRLWDTQQPGEPTVIQGHTAAVTAAAYRTDRNQIATADAAGFIRLWRTIDSWPEGTLGAHRGEVTALFYHSNNQQVISTGADGLAKVWQLPLVLPQEIASEEQTVDFATISVDGQLLATAGTLDDRPAIVIRKVEDGSITTTLLGHEGRITSLAFNANHTQLVSGSEDKTVRVWDIADAKFPELVKYSGHEAAVSAVAFADTATVVSAGLGKTIHHWNLSDGMLVRSLEGHSGAVTSLTVSSTAVASGSADGTIRLWKKSDGEVIRTIDHGAPVRQIALSSDNTKLASWGDKKQLKLWEQSDGALLKTVNADATDLTSLAFSPNSQQLAATVGNEVRVWQVNNGGELQFFPEHAKPTRVVSYLPDSKTLISVDANNGLRRSTVSAIRSIEAHDSSITDAALYQGGNALATVAGDGVVKLWTTSNGQLAREITTADTKLSSVTADRKSVV
jgi:WD40 repeat protein